MADTTANDPLDDDVEVEALPKKGGLSGKKLVFYVVLPVLLLLATAGGLYVSGMLDGLLGKEHAGDDQMHAPRASVFYDLPEMLVNLNSSGRRTNYLKLTVSLEIESEADKAKLELVQPRIIDNFQVYLRELRLEDLQGSAGMQRLREELLLRVNAAARPVKVHDVLFREMLVQ